MIAGPDQDVRLEAVWILGKLRDPKAIEALLPLLAEPGDIGLAATVALAELADRRAIPPLLSLLTNDCKPRFGLLQCLIKLDASLATDTILSMKDNLDQEDPETVAAVILPLWHVPKVRELYVVAMKRAQDAAAQDPTWAEEGTLHPIPGGVIKSSPRPPSPQ